MIWGWVTMTINPGKKCSLWKSKIIIPMPWKDCVYFWNDYISRNQHLILYLTRSNPQFSYLFEILHLKSSSLVPTVFVKLYVWDDFYFVLLSALSVILLKTRQLDRNVIQLSCKGLCRIWIFQNQKTTQYFEIHHKNWI